METNSSLPAKRQEHGVALVLTLLVLSVLALLLVTFLSAMTTERQAAGAYAQGQRAKLLAEGAVAHAIHLLRTNIPEPARLAENTGIDNKRAPGENWITNPGRLTIVYNNGAKTKTVGLHTGEVTDLPPAGEPRDAESVDLNQPLPGETVPVITGTQANGDGQRLPMRVKWVNLLRNPSQAASAENPLIGRYAFWMDDESARINFNTALGKPAAGNNRFGKDLNGGALTPLFARGDATTLFSGSGNRMWALGRPQSVNLDALFTTPSQLRHNDLLAHTFLRGFARYPEAILDFIDVPDPHAWYAQNKWLFTPYSRSPEFNAFGKSRLFTTFVPLSLEGGPSYQHPFVYEPSQIYDGRPTQILQLNSLLGNLGFTSKTTDEDDGGLVSGENVVNRMQIEMLYGYFRQKWPGYGNLTFLDKYGEAETRQIILNALLLARFATAPIATGDLTKFTREYAMRITSVNYAPTSGELTGATPERFYWRFDVGSKQKLMLPQMPGPYITEVRLLVRPVAAGTTPAQQLTQRHLQYRYQVTYYMPGYGPVVDIHEFPVRMDYFDIEVAGNEPTPTKQQFGPTNAADNRAAKRWTTEANLGRLTAWAAEGTTLGPQGATWNGNAVPNRRVVSSAVRTVGTVNTTVPVIDPSAANPNANWKPKEFDSSRGNGRVTVKIRLRPGMGLGLNADGKEIQRPKQMIPLGESQEETLQATFEVDLRNTATEYGQTWRISDPRLSSDLAQWQPQPLSPGAPGTLDLLPVANGIEPAESSSEKSKFRYLQRAPDEAKLDTFALDRGDEYQTAGRFPSPGYWSLLHTGMQSGKPWRTLDFSTKGQLLPDWLLLDIFGATYPMAHDQWKIGNTLPDSFSTASYMNSTAGQVNLNSRIYPQTNFFRPPPRNLPLEAVFKNLRSNGSVKTLVENIQKYQTKDQVFDYIGELAEVPGAEEGGTQWAKEMLLRNMAGCLTTRSNTFGVWGVAQVVQKHKQNQGYDRFEKRDLVAAEKRFYALVGRDGVPGNAHSNAAGRWDRTAQQSEEIVGNSNTLYQLPGSPPLKRGEGLKLNLDTAGSYPVFDGPETIGADSYTAASLGRVRYQASSIEDADNPPQPLIKYRVVYFKYLDQ